MSWKECRIAGNTFDYPFVHGKAIQTAGRYSFVSCSSETVESGSTDLTPYYMVDIIYGAENSTLSNRMQQALTNYLSRWRKIVYQRFLYR